MAMFRADTPAERREADAAAAVVRAAAGDPRPRLKMAHETLTEARTRAAEQRVAKERAERHLAGAEQALAALVDHHRKVDAGRAAQATAAIRQGRTPDDDEPTSDAAVERAKDRAALARRALEIIGSGLARAELAENKVRGAVLDAAQAVLLYEADEIADQLIEADRTAARLRGNLRALTFLRFKTGLSARLLRLVNVPDSSEQPPVIDWAARLKELVEYPEAPLAD